MQFQKRGDVPTDPQAEFTRFADSIVHRVLHNDLVVRLHILQERLENQEAAENFRFIQGEINGIKEALGMLHRRHTSAVKKAFGYENV